MSDEPLFQNSDVQESAYGGDGGDNDQSGRGDNDVGPGVVIPAAGLAGLSGGMGGTAGPTGTGAVGPALAGAALAGDVDDDDSDRTTSDGVNDGAGQTPSG